MSFRLAALATFVALASCESSLTPLPEAPEQRPGSISGTIVAARPGEATRRAVVGAHVEIVGTTLSDTTDDDGRFLIEGVQQTAGTLLIREPPGSGRAPRQRVLRLERLGSGPNRQVSTGDLVLSENARVRGLAKRGDKAGQASGHGAIVVFVPEAPYLTQTGDDGSYLLPDLPEGPVQIAFSAPGYEPSALDGLELRAGEDLSLREVLLGPGKLPDPGRISARVVLQPAPADPQPIVLTAVAGDGQVKSTSANASAAPEAAITLEGLNPGVYRVLVGRAGYATAEVPNVLVRPGEETRVPSAVVLTPPDGTEPACTEGAACTPADPCREGRVQCISGVATCVAAETPRAPGTSCGEGYVCNTRALCVACGAGGGCTPLNRCHTGTLSCDTGEPVCVDTGTPTTPGLQCDEAKVCSTDGECVSCDDGAVCEPAPCRIGSVSCESGEPVCRDLELLAVAGTACGEGRFCDGAGRCNACTPGGACVPPSNTCRLGEVSCDSGTPRCVDTGSPALAGLSCGTNRVCDGLGTCALCDAGASCVPEDPCREGAIACDSGTPECVETGAPRAAGAACAEGRVCDGAGACVTCASGSGCEPSACHLGAVRCESGAPVCEELGLVALAGTACGEGKVCDDAGRCNACAAGSACVPANACRLGRLGCDTGAPRCIDTGAAAPAGKSCGNARVCDGAGSCAFCDAGASCVPDDPCHEGKVACANGKPECVDTGVARAAGTSCADGRVCSGSGACVACVEGASCTSTVACRAGEISCSSGSPACVATTRLAEAGSGCGTDKVCDVDGTCVACAEGAACAPASACHLGVVRCASGHAVCQDTLANVASGSSCGDDLVCNAAGACVSCDSGADCSPANACHVGAIACASGAPVCADTSANRPDGLACATGKVCKEGACVACNAGASCVLPNNCRVGAIDCASGDPVCADTGANATDGSPCGTGKVCRTGACVASGLSVIAGDNQTAYTGQLLATIQFRLLNAVGSAVVNETITFAPPAGAVALPASVNTDFTGTVSVSLRLPPRTGTWTLTATSATGSSARVTATSTEPPIGTVHTVVNTDHSAGNDGNNGPAFRAHLRSPVAIARASDGTYYVADHGGCQVRRVAPDGTITAFAGTGVCANDPPGNLATSTRIGNVSGVAIDESRGVLYVSDASWGFVRSVDLTSRVLSNFAGGGNAPAPGYGDGGPASGATVNGPGPLSIGPDGLLYVAQTSGNYQRIRRINLTTTTIETFYAPPASQTCSALQESHFVNCGNDSRGCAIAWDSLGNAYVSVFGCGPFAGSGYGWAVQRIASDGGVSHVTGRMGVGAPIDNNSAPLSPLVGPAVLAVDAAGDVWLSDGEGHRVRRIDMGNGRMRFAAGTGVADYFGDFVPSSSARFNTPTGLVFEPDGSLLVTDRDNQAVRRILKVGGSTPSRARLELVSGNNLTTRVDEALPQPLSVRALDSSGAALTGSTVRWVALDPGAAVYSASTPVNGTGVASTTVRAGLSTGTYRFEAHLSDLRGQPAQGSPVLLTATATAPAAGTIFTAVNIDRTAGNYPTGSYAATLGRLSRPRQIAVAADGGFYVADSSAHAVWKITSAGQMTVVAGTPGSAGFAGDGGAGSSARINNPYGVALAKDGRQLFIADTSNDRIRAVDLAAGTISTYAGGCTGTTCPGSPTYGDGGAATAAVLSSPAHLQIGPDGALYFADRSRNGRIRRIDPTTGIITELISGNTSCNGTINLYNCGTYGNECSFVIDAEGSTYISANLCGAAVNNVYSLQPGIVKRAPDGTLSHFAGYYYASGNGFADGLPANRASFVTQPLLGLAENGDLLFSENTAQRLRRYDAATGLVSRLAGTGATGFSGEYVPAATAVLNEPWIPASLGGGRWVFGDASNSAVRIIW